MSDDRRKPGRPKAEEPKTLVSAWVPTADADRLIQMAQDKEQSVSRTMGQILRQSFSK